MYCQKCGKEIADGSTFCPECGTSQGANSTLKVSVEGSNVQKTKGETAKMVVGIISMVLFIVIALQSCAAGIGNALAENGESSGTAGFMLALFMLVAGIVGVAARKSRAGGIVSAVLYILAGLIGITGAGSYADLKVWSGICFVFGVLFILLTVLNTKANKQRPIVTGSENKKG